MSYVRGAVHTETDVPLAAHGRFTRMDPHADAKLRVLGPDMIRQRPLARDRGGDRVLRPSVRDEERVALRVDLAAAVLRECLAQDPVMIGERLSVDRPAQPFEQRGRSLDVREEKGDGPDRKLVDRAHGGESLTHFRARKVQSTALAMSAGSDVDESQP